MDKIQSSLIGLVAASRCYRIHAFLVFIFVSNAAFSEGVPKTCAFRGCGVGDVVVTYYSHGSPAVGCPTRNLSIYANYVVVIAATTGLSEKETKGEMALPLKQFRKEAGVTSFKEAMNKCWRLKDGQRVEILQYSERGAVKISPVAGGLPYWTQSNHLDRP